MVGGFIQVDLTKYGVISTDFVELSIVDTELIINAIKYKKPLYIELIEDNDEYNNFGFVNITIDYSDYQGYFTLSKRNYILTPINLEEGNFTYQIRVLEN